MTEFDDPKISAKVSRFFNLLFQTLNELEQIQTFRIRRHLLFLMRDSVHGNELDVPRIVKTHTINVAVANINEAIRDVGMEEKFIERKKLLDPRLYWVKTEA